MFLLHKTADFLILNGPGPIGLISDKNQKGSLICVAFDLIDPVAFNIVEGLFDSKVKNHENSI
jgi:hypothetical protein